MQSINDLLSHILIGDCYNDNPIDFNFLGTSNQDDFELNDENWSRVINKYNLIEDDIKYEYLYIPKNFHKKSTINFVVWKYKSNWNNKFGEQLSDRRFSNF